MFKNFYKQLEENKPFKPKEYVDLNNSALFNPNLLYDRLSNIDALSDKELFELLKPNYETILSEACSDIRPYNAVVQTDPYSDITIRTKMLYLSLFLNTRFLTILSQTVNSQYETMSYSSKILCNKIVYDYLTSTDRKDEYTKTLMYSLARIVNKSVIPTLIGRGLNEDLASYLALARYSSQKENVNIKRLNFIIITSPEEIMTEQMIVYIYESLFNNITLLFETTMFDTCVDNIGTDSCGEIYSRISLALLDLLENMPIESIRKVLISYSGDYKMLHHGEITRFSMHSISGDYPRINSVVGMLEGERTFLP